MTDVLCVDCGQAVWECIYHMDTEANQFAAYLLMPEGVFEDECAKGSGDLCDTTWLERLAKKFKVPTGAVAYRLMLMERKP